MTMGRGGVHIKRYQKEYFYVCDLGGRGGSLRLTKLTFNKNNKNNGAENASTSVYTGTEGQSSGSLTMELVMDEKFQRMKSVQTDCDRPMYKNFITCAIDILYAISTTGYHSHKKSILFTFVNQAKVSCSVPLSAQTNLSLTWGGALSKGVSVKISFFRSKRLTFILRRRGSLKNRISKLRKKIQTFGGPFGAKNRPKWAFFGYLQRSHKKSILFTFFNLAKIL